MGSSSQTYPGTENRLRPPPLPPKMQGALHLYKSCTQPFLGLCYGSEGSKIGVMAYGQILATPTPC
jgi:hypothetical protein